MALAAGVVAKHVERATVVRHHQIDVAIVFDVAGEKRPADTLSREPRRCPLHTLRPAKVCSQAGMCIRFVLVAVKISI